VGKKIHRRRASPEEYLAYLQRTCSMITLKELKKLPSSRVPPEFLEEAVESYIGNLVNEKKLKELKAAVKRYFEETRSAPMPTEYQEKILYFLLQKFSDEVVRIAREANFQISEKIVVGTLPTGEVNARAIRVPSGGIIIALNYGLFLFIHLLAKAVSSFFPLKTDKDNKLVFSISDDDVTRYLGANSEGHVRFVDVLLAYVVLGDPSYARQYFQKGPHFILTSVMRDIAEFFVVAHEYSHLFLNHCAMEPRFQRKLLGQVKVNEIVRSWKDEMEADNLALQITLAYGQTCGYDLSLSYMGTDFLFSCMEIVEEASGSGPSPTHPLANDRRESLRKWISDNFKEQSSAALKLGNITQRLMTKLWTRNKPFFGKASTELRSKLDL